MVDPLKKTWHDSPDAPANRGIDVTPHDSLDFTELSRALFVGVGGDIVVVWNDGTPTTFNNVPDGTLLPFAARRVNLTGTTATQIRALF